MKLQIDTELKTIKIGGDAKLDELFEKLNVLFPNETWKEYILKPDVITEWINPIIIHPYQPVIEPYRNPWINPFNPCIYSSTSVGQAQLIDKDQKSFNFEL